MQNENGAGLRGVVEKSGSTADPPVAQNVLLRLLEVGDVWLCRGPTHPFAAFPTASLLGESSRLEMR